MNTYHLAFMDKYNYKPSDMVLVDSNEHSETYQLYNGRNPGLLVKIAITDYGIEQNLRAMKFTNKATAENVHLKSAFSPVLKHVSDVTGRWVVQPMTEPFNCLPQHYPFSNTKEFISSLTDLSLRSKKLGLGNKYSLNLSDIYYIFDHCMTSETSIEKFLRIDSGNFIVFADLGELEYDCV